MAGRWRRPWSSTGNMQWRIYPLMVSCAQIHKDFNLGYYGILSDELAGVTSVLTQQAAKLTSDPTDTHVVCLELDNEDPSPAAQLIKA